MSDLRTHKLSKVFTWLYGVLGGNRRALVAKFVFNMLFRLEGGQYLSKSVRNLIKRDYSVTVGEHSYGECFVPGAFAPSVEIGKYVSVARGVRVFTQNHPTNWVSTHPYFYEQKFNVVKDDKLEPATLKIGHDVWIGQGAIILPRCKEIGTGAIIGAGSVVTKTIPPYAIVGGNPAKVIRYRFSDDKVKWLLGSQWWDMTRYELSKRGDSFITDVGDLPSDTFGVEN